MSQDYETAFKEALAVAPKELQAVDTLEFDHPDFPQPYYMVNDRQPFRARLAPSGPFVDFQPVGLSFAAPKSDASGLQEMPITIVDMRREVSRVMLSIADSPTPVTVRYRPYLLNDPSRPQSKAPLVLFIRDVKIVDGSVSARASFADLLNKPFLGKIYNRREFPALA